MNHRKATTKTTEPVREARSLEPFEGCPATARHAAQTRTSIGSHNPDTATGTVTPAVSGLRLVGAGVGAGYGGVVG